MNPEHLLPQNLRRSLNGSLLRDVAKVLKVLEDEGATPLIIERVTSNLVEKIFGTGTVQNLSLRDLEVVMTCLTNHVLDGNIDERHKILSQYLPTYLGFNFADQINASDLNSSKHLLVGSFTPTSTLGHQAFIRRVFGEQSNALAIDIESPRLTNIGNQSIQASALDMPFSGESMTTVTTNNLLGYLGNLVSKYSALVEIDRVLKVGGCYVGVEFGKFESFINDIFVRFLGYSIEFKEVARTLNLESEIQYFNSPNYEPEFVVHDDDLIGFKITKRQSNIE